MRNRLVLLWVCPGPSLLAQLPIIINTSGSSFHIPACSRHDQRGVVGYLVPHGCFYVVQVTIGASSTHLVRCYLINQIHPTPWLTADCESMSTIWRTNTHTYTQKPTTVTLAHARRVQDLGLTNKLLDCDTVRPQVGPTRSTLTKSTPTKSIPAKSTSHEVNS